MEIENRFPLFFLPKQYDKPRPRKRGSPQKGAAVQFGLGDLRRSSTKEVHRLASRSRVCVQIAAAAPKGSLGIFCPYLFSFFCFTCVSP